MSAFCDREHGDQVKNTNSTTSAAEWLANLDITAILQHLNEARQQDADDRLEVKTLAEQRLTCSHCPHEWGRLVMLEDGGVTDEALEPVRCPACRRECDPWIDGEVTTPIRALASRNSNEWWSRDSPNNRPDGRRRKVLQADDC